MTFDKSRFEIGYLSGKLQCYLLFSTVRIFFGGCVCGGGRWVFQLYLQYSILVVDGTNN